MEAAEGGPGSVETTKMFFFFSWIFAEEAELDHLRTVTVTVPYVALHIMLLEEYVRKRKIRLLISDDFKEIFFSWIFSKKAKLDHLRNDTLYGSTYHA